MNELDIKKIEEKWRKYWEKEKIYAFDGSQKAKNKKIYSVDTPPPTMSGRMHIGHAFSYSQQDFIVRYKRMRGYRIYYPFGTDNNGVPTERLIEKEKNVHSRDMPRQKFIDLCFDFIRKERPIFIQDWKNIGVSCDFEMNYSTISDYSRKISQWSFLDLYEKKRLYRKDAPSMWCPECQTGISQVEAQDKEIESSFNDVVFKINNQDLVIATTRPELLPACVAVFYHPTDSRYKKLKGKKAKVPLFDFEVPIMEDERVDMKKGTGIVMCCTFGDQTDMEWQKAYNLPIKEAITREGKMSLISGKYKGMKIKEARNAIIEDLRKNNLLKKQEKIVHTVNVHERCGTEIEFVKSKQWFVKYLDLKKEMISWGRKLNWYPEYMRVRYENWIKGLQWDWLISRQRYFGVPFPVWYCKKCGEILLADEKDLPVDPLQDKPGKRCKCGSNDFIPENDVLDTWFTSSMSPIIATRLLDKKLWDKVFPMSLRPQAQDIITFWLFNTVVKSNLHFKKNPFKDVVVSGMVTLKGKEMHKSSGNVIKPQEIIQKFGADALRYWAASSKLGESMDYEEKDVLTGKKFVTKILNASNFVFMNLKDWNGKKPEKLDKDDKEFLGKLNEVISSCTKNFDNYEYARAKLIVDEFFWDDFCNNYLELVKKIIYQKKGKEKLSAQYTLYQSLLTILKLMAPFTPFITEEIYQKYFKKYEKDKSVHISKWPEKGKEKSRGDWEKIKETLYKVRQFKSQNALPLNATLGPLGLTTEDYKIIKNYEERFLSTSGAVRIEKHKEFKPSFPKAGTETKI